VPISLPPLFLFILGLLRHFVRCLVVSSSPRSHRTVVHSSTSSSDYLFPLLLLFVTTSFDCSVTRLFVYMRSHSFTLYVGTICYVCLLHVYSCRHTLRCTAVTTHCSFIVVSCCVTRCHVTVLFLPVLVLLLRLRCFPFHCCLRCVWTSLRRLFCRCCSPISDFACPLRYDVAICYLFLSRCYRTLLFRCRVYLARCVNVYVYVADFRCRCSSRYVCLHLRFALYGERAALVSLVVCFLVLLPLRLRWVCCCPCCLYLRVVCVVPLLNVAFSLRLTFIVCLLNTGCCGVYVVTFVLVAFVSVWFPLPVRRCSPLRVLVRCLLVTVTFTYVRSERLFPRVLRCTRFHRTRSDAFATLADYWLGDVVPLRRLLRCISLLWLRARYALRLQLRTLRVVVAGDVDFVTVCWCCRVYVLTRSLRCYITCLRLVFVHSFTCVWFCAFTTFVHILPSRLELLLYIAYDLTRCVRRCFWYCVGWQTFVRSAYTFVPTIPPAFVPRFDCWLLPHLFLRRFLATFVTIPFVRLPLPQVRLLLFHCLLLLFVVRSLVLVPSLRCYVLFLYCVDCCDLVYALRCVHLRCLFVVALILLICVVWHLLHFVVSYVVLAFCYRWLYDVLRSLIDLPLLLLFWLLFTLLLLLLLLQRYYTGLICCYVLITVVVGCSWICSHSLHCLALLCSRCYVHMVFYVGCRVTVFTRCSRYRCCGLLLIIDLFDYPLHLFLRSLLRYVAFVCSTLNVVVCLLVRSIVVSPLRLRPLHLRYLRWLADVVYVTVTVALLLYALLMLFNCRCPVAFGTITRCFTVVLIVRWRLLLIVVVHVFIHLPLVLLFTFYCLTGTLLWCLTLRSVVVTVNTLFATLFYVCSVCWLLFYVALRWYVVLGLRLFPTRCSWCTPLRSRLRDLFYVCGTLRYTVDDVVYVWVRACVCCRCYRCYSLHLRLFHDVVTVTRYPFCTRCLRCSTFGICCCCCYCCVRSLLFGDICSCCSFWFVALRVTFVVRCTLLHYRYVVHVVVVVTLFRSHLVYALRFTHVYARCLLYLLLLLCCPTRCLRYGLSCYGDVTVAGAVVDVVLRVAVAVHVYVVRVVLFGVRRYLRCCYVVLFVPYLGCVCYL